jgi:hypothetical protein
MSFAGTIKRLSEIRPVDVNELNRRATSDVEKPRPKAIVAAPLDGIIIDEYGTVRALSEASCPVVSLTGKAGIGNSTLISYFRSVLNGRLVVVAPTGVASLNAEAS